MHGTAAYLACCMAELTRVHTASLQVCQDTQEEPPAPTSECRRCASAQLVGTTCSQTQHPCVILMALCGICGLTASAIVKSSVFYAQLPMPCHQRTSIPHTMHQAVGLIHSPALPYWHCIAAVDLWSHVVCAVLLHGCGLVDGVAAGRPEAPDAAAVLLRSHAGAAGEGLGA
jgi:hypothetical protein